MKKTTAVLLLLLSSLPAGAASVSTHVLDLARGVGGAGIAVVLEGRSADGKWTTVAQARTDANGRVREFPGTPSLATGLYRLTFDMTQYAEGPKSPFFPEITVTFRVEDAAAHYHVPVVVSPYGYSTYRGN